MVLIELQKLLKQIVFVFLILREFTFSFGSFLRYLKFFSVFSYLSDHAS